MDFDYDDQVVPDEEDLRRFNARRGFTPRELPRLQDRLPKDVGLEDWKTARFLARDLGAEPKVRITA
ncbi:MAG: hypothetical protein Q9224_007398 [Gallowayella concinna]